jgi:CRISPR-associated protein Cas1
MATLYIDRKTASLRHRGRSLLLHGQDGRVQRIPLLHLERVVIRGSLETDTGTLGLLAEAGIHVTLLSGRWNRRLAGLVGPLGKDVTRRLRQFRSLSDPAAASALARRILAHKLAAQQRLLQGAMARRPDLRLPLSKGRDALRGARGRLETADLPALRGIEGAAARAYFGAYRHLFPPSLGFEARRRRPPPDPVNAVLSLGYTLLHAEAVQAIHAAGLDPYLGCLHEPAHGREALAADLIEPLRPRIDALAWELFRERRLEASHFTRADGGCLLGKRGRERFYGAYEDQAPRLRRWLRRYTHALIRRLGASMEETAA